MNPVRVTVSAAETVETEYTSFTERELDSRLSGLSKGNPQLYAAELQQLLTTLNGSVLHKLDRLQALEAIRPLVYDTCDSLVRSFRNAALPLPADAHTAATRTFELLRLLGEGYKRVVNERLSLMTRSDTTRHLEPLKLALQRALLVCGRSLMEHYRLYAPEPTELWQDVHQLYRNAESLRLQAQPFEAEGGRDETALSIKQAYLRVVVLSLANPYHLLWGEAEDLYRRIGRWVHLVSLKQPDRWQALVGEFVVDLESQLPPHFRPKDRRLPTPKLPRVLDLRELVSALDERLEDLEVDLRQRSSQSSLSLRIQRNMYIRFRDALGGRQERLETRRQTITQVGVVAGLSGCHYVLNGRRGFNPETEENRWKQRLNEIDSGAELTLSPSEYLKDPDDRQEPRRARFQGRDNEIDDVWRRANIVESGDQSAAAAQVVQHRVVVWNRKNVSAGGMALFCVRPSGMRVRVGELMIYCDNVDDHGEGWRIAQVQWLRSRSDGGLEMGVRHVADSGHAVGIKAVQGVGRGSEYMRGIVVPRVNPLSREATLLTPAGVYEPGTVLKLTMNDLLLYVKLTERVRATQLFAHFRYRPVQPPS